MNVLIIQPPIVQLNTVYPSGAYLSSFFKKYGHNVKWVDLNISLFYKIFCRNGIKRLFDLCSKKALSLAEKAEKSGDENTAFNLRRYVSQKDLWCEWIDSIVSILAPSGSANSQGFENAHRFIFGAHVPRGNRMESYLASLGREPSTDDARALASFALADLADFISVVFDENFSLVRYAESLTVNENSFSQIEEKIDSPVLSEFYTPVLEELDKVLEEFSGSKKPAETGKNFAEKTLICISVPFAGTFVPALFTGRYFKQKFGESVFISLGGGFVNTELRETTEHSFYKYFDALSFDRGYGSYKALFESENFNSLYKTRIFSAEGCSPLLESDAQSELFEKHETSTLIPDFSDIDFSVYPRLIDDTNPMHRLWSDGAWLKAYMAHGCYWHKCAFCDVTLDYVKSYCPTNIKNLYEGLLAQCRQKGIFGIHFVDEAMPPVLMVEFARENIAHGAPLTWWGNIRFEKTFTRDVTDFLARGGLIGVSGGLESATGNGLEKIHKGTDLQSIVSSCCAFKESGILVHAYMIYGYWNETPLDLINSMETLRQFYANGLLDSCFWHKFVLTRHSRIFNEWQNGLHRELKVLGPEKENIPLFAKNGLHFEGEEKSEKFGAPLEFSLNEWMHGRSLEKPVWQWFNFPVPHPTVPKNFIEKKIELYEKERDRIFAEKVPQNKNRVFWLGGEKFKIHAENKNSKNSRNLKDEKIAWFFMGEYFEEKESAPPENFRGKGLCVLPDWSIFQSNFIEKE